MLASGMPDRLTKVDVERVATLARLALTPDEEELYCRQLAEILDYARSLAALDTDGVPPTTHLLAGAPAERADDPRASLAPPDALANAPEPGRPVGLFKVPRVIGV
jgi:aspartyl-tRNA(Asn)/glutamyl-tRNA(Gln) amidotransferase subunit C